MEGQAIVFILGVVMCCVVPALPKLARKVSKMVVSEPVDTGLIDLIIIVIGGVLIADAVWRWMLRRRR